MQLYHHPYSLNSQKVGLRLEEKNIDYTSFQVNPIMGMNFNSRFLEKNWSAKLPVFQNSFTTSCLTPSRSSSRKNTRGGEESSLSSGEVIEWVYKIQRWNPKLFTLSHTPPKYHLKVTKFLRRVIIARMAECPKLASAYHRKLKEAYDEEDKLKDPETLRRSKEHLEKILDEADKRLSQTTYLLGEEFTLADIVLVPLLSRLVLLNLKNKYVATRPHLAKYWNLVKRRPSYIKVIGKYFDGWRRHKQYTV